MMYNQKFKSVGEEEISLIKLERFIERFKCVSKSSCLRHYGGYSVGVPPLPIPNREVKPVRADGTAYSGRVGSRRPFKSKCRFGESSSSAALLFLLNAAFNYLPSFFRNHLKAADLRLKFCAINFAAKNYVQSKRMKSHRYGSTSELHAYRRKWFVWTSRLLSDGYQ